MFTSVLKEIRFSILLSTTTPATAQKLFGKNFRTERLSGGLTKHQTRGNLITSQTFRLIIISMQLTRMPAGSGQVTRREPSWNIIPSPDSSAIALQRTSLQESKVQNVREKLRKVCAATKSFFSAAVCQAGNPPERLMVTDSN